MPRGNPTAYSGEQIRRIIELVEAGKTDAEIAVILTALRGRPTSANAVDSQRWKIQKSHPQLNLRRTSKGLCNWTDDEDHLLKGLASDGFTLEEIAERMNAEEDFKPLALPFTKDTVRLRLLKLGLSFASQVGLNRSWTEEQNEWLVAMVCDKPLEEPAITDEEIAEFLETKFKVPFNAQ